MLDCPGEMKVQLCIIAVFVNVPLSWLMNVDDFLMDILQPCPYHPDPSQHAERWWHRYLCLRKDKAKSGRKIWAGQKIRECDGRCGFYIQHGQFMMIKPHIQKYCQFTRRPGLPGDCFSQTIQWDTLYSGVGLGPFNQ